MVVPVVRGVAPAACSPGMLGNNKVHARMTHGFARCKSFIESSCLKPMIPGFLIGPVSSLVDTGDLWATS